MAIRENAERHIAARLFDCYTAGVFFVFGFESSLLYPACLVAHARLETVLQYDVVGDARIGITLKAGEPGVCRCARHLSRASVSMGCNIGVCHGTYWTPDHHPLPNIVGP